MSIVLRRYCIDRRVSVEYFLEVLWSDIPDTYDVKMHLKEISTQYDISVELLKEYYAERLQRKPQT